MLRSKRSSCDEGAAQRLLSSPPNGDVTELLRRVLRGYRPGGWLKINQAAELADLSVRSLQRRLALDGQVFSELSDQVRCDLAMELLRESELSVEEISQKLGYSTQSNFSRAFQRWTEQSPTEFRDADRESLNG
jgi:AraC-like DNA-binding protein